jgi:colanic acid/amylovoran biosynthesis glycosyltransferase
MPSSPHTLLVYRDRIGVASETEFLRRQYVGFTTLTPLWIGRHLMARARELGAPVLQLGGGNMFGGLHRLLYRQFRVVPRLDLPPHAPVIHAQFARGGALALPLAQKLGVPMVVTLHGGDVSKTKNFYRGVLSRRWPEVIAATRRFVCVSAAVAAQAARRGARTEQIVVLPIGADPLDSAPPPDTGPPYHLFVGRFVAKKGIVVLADAVRRLRAAGDTTLVVCAGDGPLRPVMEALARETTGVELTGWLPPREIAARMAGARALLVPSIVAENGDAEGLPSVIPEAMAQACPVIGSNQGGIVEAVTDGATGLLVPAGDATALADAMRRLAYDAPLRHSLGQAAFTYARAHLNARIQSAALEKLLLEVGG